jgi:hypothetical protein
MSSGAIVSAGDVRVASAAAGPHRIDMDRRVCTITPDRIEVRPSRSSVLLPALGLVAGLFSGAAVVSWQSSLPFALVVLLVLAAVVLLPLSGLGFVYSVAGAHVVVDRAKQSAVWQQGLLGMGVGTRELVPFWKVERLDVGETVPQDHRGLPQDVAQFEVTLLKTSGRRLRVGAVTVPRSLAADGLERARLVAEGIAGMAGKPVRVAEPRRRRPRVVRPRGVASGR